MSRLEQDSERRRMVREQLSARGLRDDRVLDAMARVPRHLFVPESLEERAYEDRPQPIGARQTISQPLMVAQMTELLSLDGPERVLEVGTGSGYQTAILAELAKQVYTVERHDTLAERARELLAWMGYTNVEVHVGDGSRGLAALAPFDRILVTAGAPEIPQPLVEQLAGGGRLVLPVGPAERQQLTLVTKSASASVTTVLCGECMFVPLVGEFGWSESEA